MKRLLAQHDIEAVIGRDFIVLDSANLAKQLIGTTRIDTSGTRNQWPVIEVASIEMDGLRSEILNIETGVCQRDRSMSPLH